MSEPAAETPAKAAKAAEKAKGKGKAEGRKKGGRGGGGGGLSIASHPRASDQVRRIEWRTGLAGFLLAAILSCRAGVPGFELGIRALLAGVAGHLVGRRSRSQVSSRPAGRGGRQRPVLAPPHRAS